MAEIRRMVLQKLGGAYQLQVSESADLKYVLDLSEAHWMATNAPCDNLSCDKELLAFLDSDGNGQIRSDEVKTALKWALAIFKDYSGFQDGNDCLDLKSISTENAEASKIHEAALFINKTLKKEEDTTLSLADVQNRKAMVAAENFNGDGVVPAGVIKDEELIALHQHIIQVEGSVADISGAPGVNEELLNKFVNDAQVYIAWEEQGEDGKGGLNAEIYPFQEETAEFYKLLTAVEPKIEEYFALCKLLKLDRRCEDKFLFSEDALKELNVNDIAATSEAIKKLPLTKPEADGTLHFECDINPEFKDGIEVFRKKVLKERMVLTSTEWQELKAKFTVYSGWIGSKPAGNAGSLGKDVLAKYLAGDGIEKLRELIKSDLDVADELKMVDSIEKLILIQKWFMRLANNYVSLKDLFDPEVVSLIQAGTLVMDGRHFDLCVKVKDRNKHKAIAKKSNICVCYLILTRKNGDKDEKMDVATAVTAGFMTHLFIGKKGIFFTPDKVEWDAEIVDVLQQPVSLAEAMCRPFVKIGEFIAKQVEKFKTSRYKNIETNLDKRFSEADKALSAPAAKPAAPGGSFFGGSMLLLGGGVSLAAIGSVFALIANMLKNVSFMQVLLAAGGIFLIVAIPIFIAAILKLRKRNLGVFLEANGWAVNAPLRLTRKMGLLFTHVPSWPENARKKHLDLIGLLFKRVDIQRESRITVMFFVIIILIISVLLGYYLKEKIDPCTEAKEKQVEKNIKKVSFMFEKSIVQQKNL